MMPKPIDQRWLFRKPTYAKYFCVYCGAGFDDIKSLVIHKPVCPKNAA
jgi:hypothetical protein